MRSKINQEQIGIFDAIASRYDFVNSIISFGLYRHWNKKFLSTILAKAPPKKMLDLCCGTGIVASNLLAMMQKSNLPLPSIDCVDFSEEMLHRAKAVLGPFIRPQNGVSEACLHCTPQNPESCEDTQPFQVQFIHADALHLPVQDCSYDTISIAYGIRNLSPQKAALREMVRVLKPGGTLHILELFEPKSLALSLAHKLYLRSIVPLVGGCMTRHLQPYIYLAKSLNNYSLSALLMNVEEIGSVCETVTPLFCGVAAIVTIRK